MVFSFFFSSRRRHTRLQGDWSSDVCSSDLLACGPLGYHGSKAAMKVLARADVVLALGSRLGPFGVLPQYGFDYWPANAKRSEERRVGKEGRSRRGGGRGKKKAALEGRGART